jgi:hypothetical protein
VRARVDHNEFNLIHQILVGRERRKAISNTAVEMEVGVVWNRERKEGFPAVAVLANCTPLTQHSIGIAIYTA